MSDNDEKTIIGTCTELSIKGDWTTFMIDTGSQYPTRLSTKLPTLVEQVKAFGSGRGVWHFKETQGNENPNKPGTHYVNRYFSKVEPAGNGAGSIPETQQKPVDWERKDRLIVRQTIIKAVVPLFINEGTGWEVGPVLEIATALEGWVYRDIDSPELMEKEIPGGTAAGVPEGFDDSIPFAYVP